jgi:glycosyltransferase involved in cell wall biosynthesis
MEKTNNIKICLNMIVKDESAVICRCMNSISHLLDAVVISDTGSTDNTVAVMNKWIEDKKITGKVFQNKWVNFGHSRTEALRNAESVIKNIPGTWYILFMDADDYVVSSDISQSDGEYSGDNIPEESKIVLDKSEIDPSKIIYHIGMKCGTLSYDRTWMIKYDPNRPWKWFHPLHEYIGLESGMMCEFEIGKIKSGYILATRDGARSKDPMKYLRDAVTLEGAIKELLSKDPNAVVDSREMFYLAQSYRDSGILHLLKNAEIIYKQRIKLGGWDEEIYISYIEAAKCRQRRGKDDYKCLELFMKAYELRPHRYEAPYHIVRWFRLHNLFKMGYTFGRPLLKLPYPVNDRLFVNVEIHTWMFFDEVAVCAFHSGDKATCKNLCEKMLKSETIPLCNRARIQNNFNLSL